MEGRNGLCEGIRLSSQFQKADYAFSIFEPFVLFVSFVVIKDEFNHEEHEGREVGVRVAIRYKCVLRACKTNICREAGTVNNRLLSSFAPSMGLRHCVI